MIFYEKDGFGGTSGIHHDTYNTHDWVYNCAEKGKDDVTSAYSKFRAAFDSGKTRWFACSECDGHGYILEYSGPICCDSCGGAGIETPKVGELTYRLDELYESYHKLLDDFHNSQKESNKLLRLLKDSEPDAHTFLLQLLSERNRADRLQTELDSLKKNTPEIQVPEEAHERKITT